MDKIKTFFLKLIAKRVIDKTTGKETFEKSKTKIGAIIAAVAFIVDNVLPEFGVYLPISNWIIQIAQIFGITLSGYGLRDAQEKTDLALAKK